MSENVHEAARGEGDEFQIALEGSFQMFGGGTGFLPLSGKFHFLRGEAEIGAAVAVVVEDEQTVKGVQRFATIHVELRGVVAVESGKEAQMIGIAEVGAAGNAQRFAAGTGADVETAFADVQHDFVAAEPLAQFVDVFLLDEQAVFRKQIRKRVVDEAHHGELMTVQAAHVHLSGVSGLEVQTGQAFGAVVVADAEGHPVDDVLEEVAGPEHSAFFGEGRQRLEPYRIHGGQLVGTASLLHGKNVRFLVKTKADVASGQTTQKFHEGAAVHARRSFFLDLRRIRAGELDVHIRGHDGEPVSFGSLHGLKPDRTQIRGSRLAGNDGRRLLQAFNDLFLFYG